MEIEMFWQNQLIINTAGLLNKIVPRLKLDFLRPLSLPPAPAAYPSSPGTWLWVEWVCRLTSKQSQEGYQVVSSPVGSRNESSQWEGEPVIFCPSAGMFCLLEYPSISFIQTTAMFLQESREEIVKKRKSCETLTKSTWPILSTFKYLILLLLSSFVILPYPYTAWSIMNIFFKSTSLLSRCLWNYRLEELVTFL